ncbi:alpha/beta hydrolase fold domain-containing protein [Amnibacterium flavum]|uniref:alpha/beta hydrolase fold domain-containing protein n=1 Tax=Amnibacterium flavum TaxID=2173173 RepID=UPI001F0CA5A4|nr:alpha/beta hydrolase [Amnibacterium flavum]
MPTVPLALVTQFLRLTRANRTYVTAEGARRRVHASELRPEKYGPPARLRSDVAVTVRHDHPWPVYTVTPTTRTARGSVVYLHGGGWVGEIVVQHWQLAAQIAAEAGTTVTVPIYPLVPFGNAREAAEGVTALVLSNEDRYGDTCLAGDSAGGQIALSAALELLHRHGMVVPRTELIAPALDLTWSNPRIPVVQPTDPWLGTPGGRVLAEYWRGDLDILDPLVSPLMGDPTGLGPISVFTGTRDVLNPDAHLLAAKAAEAGVSLDFHEQVGQLHNYPLLPTKVGASARKVIVADLHHAIWKVG